MSAVLLTKMARHIHPLRLLILIARIKYVNADFNITPKYIYVIVRENRNRYKDKLQQHFGITLHENINESDETSYSDTVVNTSASSVMLNKKKFDIIVSAEKWRIIKPIRKYITNAYIGFYNPVGRTL